MSHWTPQDIDELVAKGRRLVQEAKEAMEKTDRLFAEQGIDPRECLEHVRRIGGEEAVAIVKADAAEMMRRIQEEIERQKFHAAKPRPAGKRARIHSNMI